MYQIKYENNGGLMKNIYKYIVIWAFPLCYVLPLGVGYPPYGYRDGIYIVPNKIILSLFLQFLL